MPPRLATKHLGPNLRRLRRAARLSQGDLAARAKLSRDVIAKTETAGRARRLPDLDSFVKMCLALRVSSDTLLETPQPQPTAGAGE